MPQMMNKKTDINYVSASLVKHHDISQNPSHAISQNWKPSTWIIGMEVNVKQDWADSIRKLGCHLRFIIVIYIYELLLVLIKKIHER